MFRIKPNQTLLQNPVFSNTEDKPKERFLQRKYQKKEEN